MSDANDDTKNTINESEIEGAVDTPPGEGETTAVSLSPQDEKTSQTNETNDVAFAEAK